MVTKTTAVIVVTCNSAAHLPCLIASLNNQTTKEFKVFFVDNASKDETVLYLQSCSKNFKWDFIFLPANTGFAAGNNKGILRALEEGFRYVMIVNPDMELHPSCIQELAALLDRYPETGMTGPVVLYGGNKKAENLIQVYGVKANFNTQTKAMLYTGQHLSPAIPSVLEVDYVNGGSMMVRAEVFKTAGLFEEDYFMYNDELDLAFRMHQQGYRVMTTRQAIVWHHHDWTKKNKRGYFLMYYYGIRNKYLYFIKWKLYKEMIREAVLEIFLFPYRIAWAVKTADLRLLWYYYLGFVHGLLQKKGKSTMWE